MTDQTIMDLTPVVSLAGDEAVYVVQPGNATTGANRRATVTQIAAIANPTQLQIVGLSVLGVPGTATANVGAITGGGADQVLRISQSGTALGFGAINLATTSAVTGVLPVANGGIGTALITAFGVPIGNGTSAVSSAVGTASGQILLWQNATSSPAWRTVTGDITISSTGIASATLGTGSIAYASLQTTAGPAILGNATTAIGPISAIIGTTDQVARITATGLAFGAINLATTAAVTGVLLVSNGGLGTGTLTTTGLLLGNGASPVGVLAPGTSDQVVRMSNATTVAYGAVNLATSAAVAGALPATNGGTGQTTYAIGDLLIATTATALARLADIATTNVLLSGGVGVAPSWGKVGLSPGTSAVTGTLGVVSGGIGTTALLINALLAGGTNATSAVQTLATTGATGQVVMAAGGAALPVLTTLSVMVGANFDGGGVALTSNTKLDIGPFSFAGTITQFSMLCDTTGTVAVDIWKSTYATFPPTVSSTITGSVLPTVSGSTKYQTSTLTGWQTAIASGDVLRFNIGTTITTVSRMQLMLQLNRTSG